MVTKAGISDAEFARQYEALRNAKAKPELRAVEASYDDQNKQIIVRLDNGSTVFTPLAIFPEFKSADARDLAEVQLRYGGTSLHWERLDEDFTVGGLISTVFGRDRLMAELGRKGGSVQSEAKSAAARENGRKGGRPPREQLVASAPRHSLSIQLLPLPEEPDLITLPLSGGSHQSVSTLATHEYSLNSAYQGVGLSGSPTSGAPVSASILVGYAFASLAVEQLKEESENSYAELPVAA
jgi:general stress protein YciG